MKKSILQLKIAQLPQNSGVYFFRDQKGKTLYIGKATNLRSRVQSYFRNVIPNSFRDLDESGEMLKQVQHDTKGFLNVPGRSEWIGLMVSQVADIDFEQTDSVLEALI
ncbi:MAG: nucleotide excision repair endonuclease, partial [Candidatus Moranbacteria bacterium]|nr:nucleotide excision repair endonuclease [Candidatus Moranbacteria bacterium]